MKVWDGEMKRFKAFKIPGDKHVRSVCRGVGNKVQAVFIFVLMFQLPGLHSLFYPLDFLSRLFCREVSGLTFSLSYLLNLHAKRSLLVYLFVIQCRHGRFWWACPATRFSRLKGTRWPRFLQDIVRVNCGAWLHTPARYNETISCSNLVIFTYSRSWKFNRILIKLCTFCVWSSKLMT